MARRWVAVEEDDDNACEPCAKIDGTTYRNREDAWKDYPNGVGYKDCIGAKFGNSCRGRLVKRRGAENQGDSMSKLTAHVSNLLASNASILAQLTANRRAPVIRDSYPADWFRIENVSAEEASVYIYDEIGFWGTSAAGFVEQLNAISTPKLNIHINSPGGDVFDGVAIHSALMASKAHVTVYIDGIAASAASFIAMAGDNIVMARNATMMIHEASGLVWGNKRDCKKQMELLDKLDNNIADMYSLQAGGTIEEWMARMEAETWYTGQEALALGLVDEITSPDEEESVPGPEEPPMNRLSLAAFNFAGRAEAPAPVIPEPVEDVLCECPDAPNCEHNGIPQEDVDGDEDRAWALKVALAHSTSRA